MTNRILHLTAALTLAATASISTLALTAHASSTPTHDRARTSYIAPAAARAPLPDTFTLPACDPAHDDDDMRPCHHAPTADDDRDYIIMNETLYISPDN